MTRLIWLTFYGPERFRDPQLAEDGTAHEVREPHESPALMTIPLVVLAVLSAVAFVINLPFTKQSLDFLNQWLAPSFAGSRAVEVGSFSTGLALSTFALVVAVGGILWGASVYRKGLTAAGEDPIDARLGPVAKVWAHAYYFDIGLARVVSGPVAGFARFLADGVDRKVIDGTVNGIGVAFRTSAGGLRRMQTGLVRNYALGIAVGAVALLIFFVLRVNL
jgi:NADH-quinone oxidoreductase subunit L